MEDYCQRVVPVGLLRSWVTTEKGKAQAPRDEAGGDDVKITIAVIDAWRNKLRRNEREPEGGDKPKL